MVAVGDAQRIVSGNAWEEKLTVYADIAATLSPEDRQLLMRAVLQEDPGARTGWLTRDALATLGPEGRGAISGSAVDAASASLTVSVDGDVTGMERAGQLYDANLADLVDTPVADWTSGEAVLFTSELARLIEENGADTELVETLLMLSESQLLRSAELLGNATENKNGEEGDVKSLTEAISRIGNAVPEESAARLAYIVASKIPDRSELNWVDDGFGEYIDRQDGNPFFRSLLAAALYDQGKNDAGDEMLYKGAGGVFGYGGLVDDATGIVRDTFDTLKSLPSEAWHFVSEQVIDRAGDWLRDRLSDALGVEQRIGMLNEPGDSIYVGADIAGTLFGGQIGLPGGAKIIKTDNGYRLELFGESSAGVAAKLSFGGIPNGLDAAAEGGAGVTVAFEFQGDDAQGDVIQASEALLGLAVGISAPVPLGAVMVASTLDELDVFSANYQGISLEFSQSLMADAEGDTLASAFGLSGVEAAGLLQGSIRIEIPANGTPQLVLMRGVALDAALEMPNTGGVGELRGSASLAIETLIPIEIDFDRVFDDPGSIGSVVLDAMKEGATGAVTTVTGILDLEGNVNASPPGFDVGADASVGVQLEFNASGTPSNVLSAIGEAVSGDLSGAIDRLGSDDLSFTLRRYGEVGFGAGEVTERVDGDFNNEADGVDFNLPGVGGVEITAGYAQRTSEIVWEGPADELNNEFPQALEDIGYYVG